MDNGPGTMDPRQKTIKKLLVLGPWSMVLGPISLLLASLAFASPLSPQSLAKGESSVIQTDYEIGDVAIANPKVADFIIQDERKSLYLNAKSEGFTTLTLWNKDGELKDVIPVTVHSASLSAILREAEQSFASIKSIDFLVQDDVIRIVGEAPSPSDYKRIQSFAARYPQILNEVIMAKPVLDTMTSRIEKAIAMPGIKVRSVKDRVVLEGVAFSQGAANKAYEIAKLYDPTALNLIEIRQGDRTLGKEEMVQIDLYFMEIQKSALRTFGIQWAPGSFPAGGGENPFGGGGGDASGGIGGLGQSLIGFVLNLVPKIRFIREKGLGRVLENPTIFVKSGDLATFFSGVQVPYFAQQNVQFKEVGVKVEAQPVVSGSDVDLKMSAQISTPSAHIDGGINTHSINTTAYIPSGQAMVLGGILSGRDVKTYNRVPKDLSTSSALFTLFLSKDFQTSKTELVVFALPKIVAAQADLTSLKEDWAKTEEQMLKDRSMKEYLEYMKKRKKINSKH
ncbi:MAG: pilus assembly protein N-terminal domain-containing protein [Deltaproteobacteria bacterium]|nr:pilus assembly protein N-terminal domain-containing protein [Deltaproteobacteria bacterium]